MPDKVAPLSPTVSAIFSEFIGKLEASKILEAPAIEALRKSLNEQKLDAESLRTAIFTDSAKKK